MTSSTTPESPAEQMQVAVAMDIKFQSQMATTVSKDYDEEEEEKKKKEEEEKNAKVVMI